MEMKTQLTSARKGVITEEVKQVARDEGLPPDKIRRGVAAGRIVITKNTVRDIPALGIGEGCSMCGDFCAVKILKEYLK